MAFFHTVAQGKTIGNGTVTELVTWLENYINLLFPNNGIEWWSYNDQGVSQGFKGSEQVPDHTTIHHFACYARQGNSEGNIIETVFSMRDGTFVRLCSAKNFGGATESLEISVAISVALNSIYFYHEVPELVSMSQKVPRRYNWERQTSLTEPVYLVCKHDSITIRTKSDVLFHRDFTETPDHFQLQAIEAIRKDWIKVLTNMGARIIESDIPEEAVA